MWACRDVCCDLNVVWACCDRSECVLVCHEWVHFNVCGCVLNACGCVVIDLNACWRDLMEFHVCGCVVIEHIVIKRLGVSYGRVVSAFWCKRACRES